MFITRRRRSGKVAGGGAAASPPVGNAIEKLFLAAEKGVWFDPSDLTTLFEDSAGTIPATVGGPVGRMLDKSGNGCHATQTTSTARPLLQQDGTKYYLQFQGVDDRLIFANPGFAGDVANFLSISGARPVAANVNNPMFCIGTADNFKAFGATLVSTGALRSVVWASDVDGGTYAANTDIIFSTTKTGVNGTGRKNGVQAFTRTFPTLAIAGTTAYIGSTMSGSGWLNGRIYGLVVREGVPVTTDLYEAEKVMAAKMGMTI